MDEASSALASDDDPGSHCLYAYARIGSTGHGRSDAKQAALRRRALTAAVQLHSPGSASGVKSNHGVVAEGHDGISGVTRWLGWIVLVALVRVTRVRIAATNRTGSECRRKGKK